MKTPTTSRSRKTKAVPTFVVVLLLALSTLAGTLVVNAGTYSTPSVGQTKSCTAHNVSSGTCAYNSPVKTTSVLVITLWALKGGTGYPGNITLTSTGYTFTLEKSLSIFDGTYYWNGWVFVDTSPAAGTPVVTFTETNNMDWTVIMYAVQAQGVNLVFQYATGDSGTGTAFSVPSVTPPSAAFVVESSVSCEGCTPTITPTTGNDGTYSAQDAEYQYDAVFNAWAGGSSTLPMSSTHSGTWLEMAVYFSYPTFSPVQGAQNYCTDMSSCTITSKAPLTAGDLVVVNLGFQNSTATDGCFSGFAFPKISDSLGNTIHAAVSVPCTEVTAGTPGTQGMSSYWMYSKAGGIDTFTFSAYSHTGTLSGVVQFEEFSGVTGAPLSSAVRYTYVSGSGAQYISLATPLSYVPGQQVVVANFFQPSNTAYYYMGTGFAQYSEFAMFGEYGSTETSPTDAQFQVSWNAPGTNSVTGTGLVFAIGSPSAPAIQVDGSNSCASVSATTITCDLTTTHTFDIGEAALALSSSASSITVTDSAGLTWTLRSTQGPAGGSSMVLEYYAKLPSPVTDRVTFSWTGTSAVSVVVFGVANANYEVPFDPVAPWGTTGTNSVPSISSVTTSNSEDMIVALTAVDNGNPYPIGPPAPCSTGSSFTLLDQGYQVATTAAVEYQVVSSVQSGRTVSFGSCDTASWGIIVDAIQATTAVGSSFTASITDMQAGNILVAGGTYHFEAVVSNNSITGGTGLVDSVGIQFAVAGDLVQFGWTNSSGRQSYTLDAGSGVVALGTGMATVAESGGVETLTVDFPVTVKGSAPDGNDISLLLQGTDSGGGTRGYEVVQLDYFQILNHGGSVTKIFTGNATSGTSGCTDCVTVGNGGSANVNTTWYGLQQYSTQFAITLSDNNFTKVGGKFVAPSSLPGDPYLWQDYNGWFASDPTYTVPGAWSIAIHWYYWDGSQWVDGEHVVITMEKGNQGTSDQWVTLGVEWYHGSTLVSKSENVTAWIENGASSAGGPGTAVAQVRLFVDLWFSDANASETMGGHVGAYFFGMHSSGYFWWTSWSPAFENSSISQVLSPVEDHTGTVVSSTGLLFSKIGYVVTRTLSPSGSASETKCGTGVSNSCRYFTVSLHNFDIEKYITTPASSMGGVGTPAFTAPQVPDLPQGGFLTPLYALLAALAGRIWLTMAGALASIWATLGTQFPWFTAFWSDLYTGLISFSNFFQSVFPVVMNGVNFVLGFFGFLTPILTTLENAYAWWQRMFAWIPVAEMPAMIEVAVLWVFSMSVMNALYRGDWKQLFEWARIAWNIVREVMYWMYLFATEVINQIIGLIP